MNTITFPCGICCKNVTSNAIECCICYKWIHVKCASLRKNDLKRYENFQWSCPKCAQCFPFHAINNDELIHSLFGSHFTSDDNSVYSKCKEFDEMDVIASDPLVLGLQSNNQIIKCKYYGEEELSEKIIKKPGLSLIHFNARSLSKNFKSICSCVSNLSVHFDVIAVTETWLEDENTKAFDIEGYQVTHIVRQGKRGGGCSIYVNDVIKFNIFKPLCVTCDDVFECTAVELQINNKHIIIACVYRPPGGSIVEFNSKWENVVNNTNHGHKDLYICGDFNIDLLKTDGHHETQNFVSLMYGAGLFPTITKPTRITEYSSTIIDHVYSNNVKDSVIGGILINDISDHLPVFISVNVKNESGVSVRYEKQRCTKSDNIEHFSEALYKRDWSELYAYQDVNDAYDRFM